MEDRATYWQALNDFRRARGRANLEQLMAKITGASAELLSYEEVRQQLQARESIERGRREIPMDAIVGSVGRYSDFTRSFLPRQDSGDARWARVKTAMTGLVGVPPIEVYQIGDVFFVKDGNHRVSVARQMEFIYIDAYVTEVRTLVPLTPDVQPDELIIKAEYAGFLEQTKLDKLCPEIDLTVTAPGQYDLFLEHIQVHQYFMGLDWQRDVSWAEAVEHFFDTVYLPAVEIIMQRGILRDFPGRTKADLYLWLSAHRAELAESLRWEIGLGEAAEHLAREYGDRPGLRMAQAGKKFLEAVIPDSLESGPPAGQWRERWIERNRFEVLFYEILVPFNGENDCWTVLDQAIRVVQREGGRIRGLHVVADKEALESEPAQAIRDEFEGRCQAAGVQGGLALQVGKAADLICENAGRVDLVAVCLQHPPGTGAMGRLGSGFRTLIQRCPRPVLVAPGEPTPMNKALLAYDGGPKAQEALFVAAYLAGRWGTALTVVSVDEGHGDPADQLMDAQKYLEHRGIPAETVRAEGPVTEAILATAEQRDIDLLVMGGYGHSPLVGVVMGSVVDQVLRTWRRPVLICR